MKIKKKTFALGDLQVKAFDKDSGEFEAVISGVKTDRYGDVVHPEGWNLKNFKKNPVLLWAHDHYTPAIGKATKIWQEGNELLMKGVFASTPFAQEVKTLVEEGIIKAFSVGFMPLKYNYLDGGGVEFIEQELLEVSFVNVPAYAEALLTGAKQFGCNLVMKALGGQFDDEGTDPAGEPGYQDLGKKDADDPEEKEIILTRRGLDEMKKQIAEEMEAKAGKTLSKKTRSMIQDSITLMTDAAASLTALLEQADAGDEGKAAPEPVKEEAPEPSKGQTGELLKNIGKMVEIALHDYRKAATKK